MIDVFDQDPFASLESEWSAEAFKSRDLVRIKDSLSATDINGDDALKEALKSVMSVAILAAPELQGNTRARNALWAVLTNVVEAKANVAAPGQLDRSTYNRSQLDAASQIVRTVTGGRYDVGGIVTFAEEVIKEKLLAGANDLSHVGQALDLAKDKGPEKAKKLRAALADVLFAKDPIVALTAARAAGSGSIIADRTLLPDTSTEFNFVDLETDIATYVNVPVGATQSMRGEQLEGKFGPQLVMRARANKQMDAQFGFGDAATAPIPVGSFTDPLAGGSVRTGRAGFPSKREDLLGPEIRGSLKNQFESIVTLVGIAEARNAFLTELKSLEVDEPRAQIVAEAFKNVGMHGVTGDTGVSGATIQKLESQGVPVAQALLRVIDSITNLRTKADKEFRASIGTVAGKTRFLRKATMIPLPDTQKRGVQTRFDFEVQQSPIRSVADIALGLLPVPGTTNQQAASIAGAMYEYLTAGRDRDVAEKFAALYPEQTPVAVRAPEGMLPFEVGAKECEAFLGAVSDDQLAEMNDGEYQRLKTAAARFGLI